MRFFIILFTEVIITLFGAINIKSQQIVLSLQPVIRNAKEVNIGFNRRSDNGVWWTDNSFKQLLAEMKPDVLRYPAGTQANYWDWRTGKFIPNSGKNWGNKEVLKIPQFVNALPSQTKVVYVVNIARPTPATGISVNASEAILKSNATLNAKINDMLAAIAKFASLGKTPYAIELGNEFFFGNEESGIFEIESINGSYYSGWNASTNSAYVSSTKKQATVINVKFYLDQCKQIVSSIKSVYPNMEFALVATKRGNGNSVREEWNNTIFNELNTNPNYVSLKNDVHAITQHHYINDSYGSQTPITDDASSKVAIAEGYTYTQDRQLDYDMVPNNLKIWYTEYGVTKPTAEETWAGGLRYLSFTFGWMDLGDKTGQLDYHYITDNNVIKTGSPMKFAPIGLAAKLLMKAKVDMDEMQKIEFSSNPISVNGIKSLHGYKFKNNNKETAIILNINNVDLSQINFSNIFSYSGQAKMTQYFSNSPYISNVYLGHSNIDSLVGNINNSFTANKFSITVIEVENNVGIDKSGFNSNSVKVFPNPFNDYVQIESQEEISKIYVNDINGRIMLEQPNPKNCVYLGDLRSGLYMLEIHFNSGMVVRKKVIKR